MNLEELKNQTIHVLGDAMLDRYVTGNVTRISPEAPIPVVNANADRDVLGGAANVVRNICDFGASAGLLSIIGQAGSETESFLACLRELNRGESGIVTDESRPTTTKTRVLGNGQQIVRVDREVSHSITGEVEQELVAKIASIDAGAIIVADYAKGVLTPKVVAALKQKVKTGAFVAVDPHPQNKQNWSEVSVFKPNLGELVRITGMEVELKVGENPCENKQLREAIDILYKMYGIPHLLITLSEFGMVYVFVNREFHWEPARAREVFDVSGAGDTVISYFTMALAVGWSGKKAAKLANVAAGLVVQKLGTASLSFDQVKQGWDKI